VVATTARSPRRPRPIVSRQVMFDTFCLVEVRSCKIFLEFTLLDMPLTAPRWSPQNRPTGLAQGQVPLLNLAAAG